MGPAIAAAAQRSQSWEEVCPGTSTSFEWQLGPQQLSSRSQGDNKGQQAGSCCHSRSLRGGYHCRSEGG